MEEPFSTLDWITLISILVGPILAVVVTRLIDHLRQKDSQRRSLFKILMRTRGARLNPEHVGALNLVEIEFKEPKVLFALEKYFQHLNENQIGDPSIWNHKYHYLFTKLLSEMAKSLKYSIEQLQILNGAYAPRAWEEAEAKETKIRDGLASILGNSSSIPVSLVGNHIAADSEAPPGFPPKPI